MIPVKYQPNQRIVNQGDTDSCLYFIDSVRRNSLFSKGEAKCKIGDNELNTFSKNDVFGLHDIQSDERLASLYSTTEVS
jgi:CRP-like cAMP-binding protein